jgi:hypothetical protein
MLLDNDRANRTIAFSAEVEERIDEHFFDPNVAGQPDTDTRAHRLTMTHRATGICAQQNGRDAGRTVLLSLTA